MPMRRPKLNIGLIGAGNIVKERHLPALKKIDDVRIVAVCNSSYDSSERFCSEFVPDAKPYSNWAELVAEPEINVIWIGTPPYLHSTIAVSALEAGKHVFCQARMAMTLVEAEEMVAAVQRHPHLVTMLCPPPHGLRGSRFMQKLVADEYIGRPHHLRLQSLSSAYIDPEAATALAATRRIFRSQRVDPRHLRRGDDPMVRADRASRGPRQDDNPRPARLRNSYS